MKFPDNIYFYMIGSTALKHKTDLVLTDNPNAPIFLFVWYFMNRLSSILRSTRAALDLASLMVGIIVIGIIGGVIAATVFAIIPWAQDNAAKGSLDSVSTAESAYRGLAADSALSTYANKRQLIDYQDSKANKSSLISDSTSYDVQTGTRNGETCWAAVVKSSSGKYFYGTDKSPKGVAAASFINAQQGASANCEVSFNAPTTGNTAASKCTPISSPANIFAKVQSETGINCQDATPVFLSDGTTNTRIGATVVTVGKDTNAYTISATSAKSNGTWGSTATRQPTISCLYWSGTNSNPYTTVVSYYPNEQFNSSCPSTTLPPAGVVQVDLQAIVLNTGATQNGVAETRTLWTLK